MYLAARERIKKKKKKKKNKEVSGGASGSKIRARN